MTVRELVLELANYPPNATVHAYEGEEIGVAICEDDEEVGFIPTPSD